MKNIRNEMIEESMLLVDDYMNRHSKLIQENRVSAEDVKQEIYLSMLQLLDQCGSANWPADFEQSMEWRVEYVLYSMMKPGQQYGIPDAPLFLEPVLSLDERPENEGRTRIADMNGRPSHIWRTNEPESGIALAQKQKRLKWFPNRSGRKIRIAGTKTRKECFACV